MNQQHNLRKKFPYFMILPAVLVTFLLITFPLIYMVIQSFIKLDPIGFIPKWVGIRNYIRVFKSSFFWLCLKNTVIYAFLAVSAEFLLGLILALACEKVPKFKGVIRTLLILPMVVTPVVAGLTWRIMYNPTLGLINYILGIMRLPQQNWLASERYALFGVIIADIWQNFPFMFLILTAGLTSLPLEPFEAARVDGASAWQSFRHLTLPLLKPIIIVGILLRGVDAFIYFDLVFMITKGGPGMASGTLSILAYYKGFEWLDFGFASSIGCIMTGITIVIALVLIKTFRTKFL